ncbi:hypothetical protein K469DRAFT_323331 [Zopfia rhizophila CBS 207.26]|uniref:F-box domain-containing protein n=1 Tax=Zopfia rhizophila CBS 207.26 TaxID=1314779 RepID=A0A6A6DJ11_9PEZI|nr:hypothetical protein K469DRAFT_323331 [Zopfia rhizophila CBS 207.26]
MDRLPPEILAHIIQSLSDSPSSDRKISPYVSISRSWQAAVEHQTFRSLHISSRDLDNFARRFAGPNIARRRILANLAVEFVLPTEDTRGVCCDAARKPDREADTAALSKAVARLFDILSNIADRVGDGAPRLHLTFEKATKRSDAVFGTRNDRRGLNCVDDEHEPEEVERARLEMPLFDLRLGDEVPSLKDVYRFNFYLSGHLKELRQTWISQIVGRLEGVEVVELVGADWWKRGRRRRMEGRLDFGKGIEKLPILNIQELRMTIYHSAIMNEDVPIHNLVQETQVDPYNLMFHHLSQFPALTVLHLIGPLVITPTFFSTLDSQSSFPALTDFRLDFSAETADGRWFFMRDDEAFDKAKQDPKYEAYFAETEEADDYIDEEDEDEEGPGPDEDEEPDEDGPVIDISDDPVHKRYRTLPDPETLRPLLLDAASAAKKMKNIKKFIMTVSDSWWKGTNHGMSYPFVNRVLEILYLEQGTRSTEMGRHEHPKFPADDAVEGNRVYWRVGGWEPWGEVQEAWRGFVGEGGKIVFLEDGAVGLF